MTATACMVRTGMDCYIWYSICRRYLHNVSLSYFTCTSYGFQTVVLDTVIRIDLCLTSIEAVQTVVITADACTTVSSPGSLDAAMDCIFDQLNQCLREMQQPTFVVPINPFIFWQNRLSTTPKLIV